MFRALLKIKYFPLIINKNGRVDSIIIQNNATGLKTEKYDKNENDFYEMNVKEYLCPSENKKFRFAIVDQDENNKLDHFVDYALLDLNYDFIWDKVALTSLCSKL